MKMKSGNERKKIIRELLNRTDQEFTDEELIHPLIMMSQNRQEAKDRQRAENDFKVNLKSELIIDDLHKKMDLIIENQKKINHRLDMLEQTGKAIDTPKAGSPIHNA